MRGFCSVLTRPFWTIHLVTDMFFNLSKISAPADHQTNPWSKLDRSQYLSNLIFLVSSHLATLSSRSHCVLMRRYVFSFNNNNNNNNNNLVWWHCHRVALYKIWYKLKSACSCREYAKPNRCVFKCFAKVSKLKSTGKAFQLLGPATAKDLIYLLFNTLFVLRTQSLLWSFSVVEVWEGIGETIIRSIPSDKTIPGKGFCENRKYSVEIILPSSDIHL